MDRQRARRWAIRCRFQAEIVTSTSDPGRIAVCVGCELAGRYPAGTAADVIVHDLAARCEWPRGRTLALWRAGYLIAIARRGAAGVVRLQRFGPVEHAAARGVHPPPRGR